MRSSKINYLVVGVFVIGMVVALVGSIALLTGRTGATDNYHAYYANVTGVKFGTQVVYEGYPIGQVEAVIPEEKDGRMQFRVNFGVTQGWRIPNDSIGEVAAPGLLAAVTLSIKAGRSKVALKPGEQIISKERSDVFAVVSSVAGQLGELTENNIKPLLTHVDTAVQGINRIIEKEGETLFQDARKVTNDLSALVAFFEARAGQLHGFRWKDWSDYKSCLPSRDPAFDIGQQKLPIRDVELFEPSGHVRVVALLAIVFHPGRFDALFHKLESSKSVVDNVDFENGFDQQGHREFGVLAQFRRGCFYDVQHGFSALCRFEGPKSLRQSLQGHLGNSG